MIQLENIVYHTEYFPDGTQRIIIPNEIMKLKEVQVCWKYEKEEELLTLFFLTKHLAERGICCTLYMPYVPNGRMDRVKKDTEVFTLKYFAQMINQMHFKTVKVLDPHSHVLEALLHRVVIESPRKYIEKTIESIKKVSPDLVLYFPDEGAMKRYSHMFSLPFCYGLKKRNWENGEILGICVVTQGIDIREKNILMIDDIIAYGGSLYYSANALKELGCGEIYAYATHVENSAVDPQRGKLVQGDNVKQIFTTDSLFTKEHKKITVFPLSSKE